MISSHHLSVSDVGSMACCSSWVYILTRNPYLSLDLVDEDGGRKEVKNAPLQAFFSLKIGEISPSYKVII